MTDYALYFGMPGMLIEIPHPRGGVQSSRSRLRSVFRTAGGGVRYGQMAGGKRQYTLNWQQLDDATFSTLLAYDQGHMGVGPFVLLDPAQRNQLTDNQSAATSVTYSSDNFTVTGSGHSLSSDATTYHRGPRSLKWLFAYAGQSGVLTLNSGGEDWPGIPVVTRPYVFAFQARGAGPDAAITLTPIMRWYDTAGGLVSSTSGAPAATTSAAWTQMSVSATPPASAAYVLAAVAVSGASVATSASYLYLDEFQLEEGSTPTIWRPGTGVVPVAIGSLVEQWPWSRPDFRTSPTMVLIELGP